MEGLGAAVACTFERLLECPQATSLKFRRLILADKPRRNVFSIEVALSGCDEATKLSIETVMQLVERSQGDRIPDTGRLELVRTASDYGKPMPQDGKELHFLFW
jgi:hypothetical protein